MTRRLGAGEIRSKGAGAQGTHFTLHPSRKAFILLSAIILYIVVFGLLATQRHLAYETSALDLGNYDQAMWNAAHGRGLTMSTQPNLSTHRMGHHVEPILYLLLPLYWLWPEPLLLLWVQTLALGLAAWPLFLLARRRLENDWAALAIALAYLLLPATQAVNLFDFHAVALSPVFMLWALYFLDKALLESGPGNGFWPGRQGGRETGIQEANHAPRATRHVLRFTPAIIFLALAMSTKEDISLHVFMVGLYVMFLRRRWAAGGIIAAVGLIWAAIAWGLVIPAYRSGGGQSAFTAYYQDLGASPLEIALSPLTKPLIVWRQLTRAESLAALGMLTIPFAFLNLLGLPIFILAAPSLAISLLSANPLQQQLETWHYAAPMLAFVSLAAADGLARAKPVLSLPKDGQASRWAKPVLSLSKDRLCSPAYLLVLLLLFASLSYHHLRGYSPLSRVFRWPQATSHHALGDEIAATIPPEAKVAAQAELLPRVSQREHVAIWQGKLPSDADYIFMDVSHPKFINQDKAHANFISTMVFNDQFGMITTQDGYLLLQKGAERIPTQTGFQDFLFADPAWRSKASLAQFGEFFSLVGMETHLNREAEPQMTLYFHVLRQAKEDYFFRLYRLNGRGEVDGATVFQQPVLVWWPTHLWRPGDVIKVRFNTLPWWSGDGRHQRFSYALGVSTATGAKDDPWKVSLRLPATGDQVLPGNLVHLQNFYRLAGMVYVEP